MKRKIFLLICIIIFTCTFECFSAGVTPDYDTELQAVTLNVETNKLNSKAVVTIKKSSDGSSIGINDKFYSITEISRNPEGKFVYTAYLPDDADSGLYDVTVTVGSEVLTCNFTHINSRKAEYAVSLINGSSETEFAGIIEEYYTDLAVNLSEFNLYKEKLTEIFYRYKDSNLTVDTFYDIYHKALTLSKMYGADKDTVIYIINNNYTTIEFDLENFKLLESERKDEIYSRFSAGIYTEDTLAAQYNVWEALSGVNLARKKSVLDYETSILVTYDAIFNLDKTSYNLSNQKDKIIGMMMENIYDTVKEVEDEFTSACERYPYKAETTVPGPSGGGGGGTFVAPDEEENEKVPIVEQEKVIFADVDKSHWAYRMITELYKEGVIAGDGNGNFLPDKNVTRAEFAKLIAGAFYEEGSYDAGFSDVKENDWYYPYVNTLCNKGIVTGVADNIFSPASYITRQDMAVIIKRVADNKTVEFIEKENKFSDEENISEYAREAVSKLASTGIIGGMGDGTFKPQEPMTRAQAAKVIFMLAELLR